MFSIFLFLILRNPILFICRYVQSLYLPIWPTFILYDAIFFKCNYISASLQIWCTVYIYIHYIHFAFMLSRYRYFILLTYSTIHEYMNPLEFNLLLVNIRKKFITFIPPTFSCYQCGNLWIFDTFIVFITFITLNN